MMMGTADEILKSPEKGTVFVEDLPEEEQVAAVVSFSFYFIY
jgi:ubiquitin carboxyl-terminal hydrolase 14